MTIEVTPLRHRFWYQLYFWILLEELQHSGFSSTNIALNRNNERSVVRGHHFGGADGRVDGFYEVGHGRFLFLKTKIFNKLVEIPHHSGEAGKLGLYFVSLQYVWNVDDQISELQLNLTTTGILALHIQPQQLAPILTFNFKTDRTVAKCRPRTVQSTQDRRLSCRLQVVQLLCNIIYKLTNN